MLQWGIWARAINYSGEVVAARDTGVSAGSPPPVKMPGMAIRNSRIDLTTAISAFFTPVPAGVSGAGASIPNNAQGSWFDIVGLADRIQTIGYYTATGLAAAGTVTFDLTAFPAADGGTALVFTKLSIFYVQILSTTAAGGKLRVGGAAANCHPLWFNDPSDKWTIIAGGPALLNGDPISASGIAVDATHKNILLENTGAVAVDYAIYASGLT